MDPVPVRDVSDSRPAEPHTLRPYTPDSGTRDSGDSGERDSGRGARDSWHSRHLFIETEAIDGLVLERLAERFFGAAVSVTPSLWVDPLLVDLSRLQKLAGLYRCGLSLTTQGLALTRTCYDRLRDGLSHLEVLIHSPRQDVWGYCGRAREFARVTRNVRSVARQARADGIRLGLSIFPAEWTPAGIDEAVDFAASLEAGSLVLLPLLQGRCRMAPAEQAAVQRRDRDLQAHAADRAAHRGLVLLGRDGRRPRADRNRPWPFHADQATLFLERVDQNRSRAPGPMVRTLRVTRLGRLEAAATGEKLGHLMLVPAEPDPALSRSAGLSAGLFGA